MSLNAAARCDLVLIIYTMSACLKGGQAEYFSSSQNTSAWDLSNALNELEKHFFKTRVKVASVLQMESIVDLRLAHMKYITEYMEGSGCDLFWEFSCPLSLKTCISYYLVCDGHKDCPQGEDESDCANPLAEGSIWRTFFLFQQCKSTRKVKYLTLKVMNETTRSYFTSIRTYIVRYDLKYEEEFASHVNSLEQHVTYYHSSKAMLLILEAGDRWIIECNFETGDSDFCYGFVFVAGSEEPCAAVIIFRTDF